MGNPIKPNTLIKKPEAPERHDHYSDRTLRGILSSVRSIALVGASTQWTRPSYYAMKYLQRKGYKVYPVNPLRAGHEVLGEVIHPAIFDVPGSIDMVDIFRNSESALDISKEVIANKDEKRTKVLWMQLGVRNDTAAELAEEAGLTVIMNRCPKIEFARLSGELGWYGINSKIITSKRLRGPRHD